MQRSEDVAENHAIPPKSDSRIARFLGPGRDLARTSLIEDPTDALTSRIDLINAADSSIDTQYFIWQNDPTGILVIEKLLQAADRGVRVRALIDDLPMQGLVSRLNVLHDHPNIEVRIFSPFSVRIIFPFELFRLTGFAIDGNRRNHRMHNKLLITDNQLAILGGRNISDDYFGVSTERNLRCPELAGALRKNFRALIQPENTWRVTSTAEGLRWTSSTGVVDKEPAKSSWQRFQSTLVSIVPVSDLL